MTKTALFWVVVASGVVVSTCGLVLLWHSVCGVILERSDK